VEIREGTRTRRICGRGSTPSRSASGLFFDTSLSQHLALLPRRGGPGYGDPLEREPAEILEDLKKKIISDWTAQNIYRIAYDPARRKLDPKKTKQLRDDERRARLVRGKSFDEFHQEWSKKSPPQEILQWYGTWPDAKPTGPVFRP
jgi:acetophenone carboxylase